MVTQLDDATSALQDEVLQLQRWLGLARRLPSSDVSPQDQEQVCEAWSQQIRAQLRSDEAMASVLHSSCTECHRISQRDISSK